MDGGGGGGGCKNTINFSSDIYESFPSINNDHCPSRLNFYYNYQTHSGFFNEVDKRTSVPLSYVHKWPAWVIKLRLKGFSGLRCSS